TVALAPPERDLWMVATETGDEQRRYTEITGRPVDHALLETYRLRWALDDISCFVRDLRAPHRRTPGTEHAYDGLALSVAQLIPYPPPRPLRCLLAPLRLCLPPASPPSLCHTRLSYREVEALAPAFRVPHAQSQCGIRSTGKIQALGKFRGSM